MPINFTNAYIVSGKFWGEESRYAVDIHVFDILIHRSSSPLEAFLEILKLTWTAVSTSLHSKSSNEKSVTSVLLPEAV